MIAAKTRSALPAKKGAILACCALALGGCQSDNLWQGQEVLVEARHTTLERSVGVVSEDHRALRDRFDALERLYVDLVRNLRIQNEHLQAVEQKLGTIQKDPQTDIALSKVKSELTVVRKQMKTLENRVFSVEMTDNRASFTTDTAPTGTSQSGADVEASPMPAATPVNNKAATPAETFYGVHLASYRSREQVKSGWESILKAFGKELDGMTPLIYVQNQEGIGTFLRLIVGPVVSEGDADALCERIRATGGEQYCRVSEYQGEAVEQQ